MRLVFALVMTFGIGLAGFAVYTAKGYFKTSENEARRLQAIVNSMVDTVDVYVVTRKISYGERLTKEDVKLIKWPATSLPAGIYTSPAIKTARGKPGEELFPEDEIEVRAVLRTMEVNEPVLAIKVTAPGKEAGITSSLTRGMRAFAIKIDVTSGVSGFLRPGDQVDVYWTGRPSNNSGNITRLILSGVKLIAIDQSANDDRSDARIARTVTVEVTPKQVAALAQAQSTGRLALSLVGSGEISEVDAIEITQSELLDIEIKEAVVVEEERKCYIKERKGAEIVKTEVDCQ